MEDWFREHGIDEDAGFSSLFALVGVTAAGSGAWGALTDALGFEVGTPADVVASETLGAGPAAESAALAGQAGHGSPTVSADAAHMQEGIQ